MHLDLTPRSVPGPPAEAIRRGTAARATAGFTPRPALLAALAAALLLAGAVPAFAITYYSSAIGTDPTKLENWWSNPDDTGTHPADFASGDMFVIQSGHSLSAPQGWAISGEGSALWVRPAATLSAGDGAAGRLELTGSIFQLDEGATYVHDSAADWDSTCFKPGVTRQFDAASTVILRAVPLRPNADIVWGNLTIDLTTDPGADWGWEGALTQVNGDLTVTNTGGHAMRLVSDSSATVTIRGDLVVDGGDLRLGGGAGVLRMFLSGDLTVTAGVFGSSGTGIHLVVFADGVTPHVFTHSGGTLDIAKVDWRVDTVVLRLGSGLTLPAERSLTVTSTGTLALAAALANEGALQVNGILRLDVGGSVGAAPGYGARGRLAYAGGSVTAGPEWGPSGPSAPLYVTIAAGAGHSVTLSGSRTIVAALDFTDEGILATGADTLTLGDTCRVTGAGPGRYVYGSLARAISTAAPAPVRFDIGDSTRYAPVEVAFDTVGTPGTLVASTAVPDSAPAAGDPPAGSGISQSAYVDRSWTLTGGASPVGFDSCAVTLHYVAEDVRGGAGSGGLIVARNAGGTWSLPAVNEPLGTSITATGLTGFGEFRVGEPDSVPIARFELTVLAEPDLGGTVSGGGVYDSSTVVPVTAAPATGWTFTGWSGAVADSASAMTTVTMDSSVTVTAHFAPKRFELTVLADPDSGGTVSGGGTYDSSTVVPVTAAPAAGWTFTGWSGAVADSASATTTVTMDSSVTVTAHFAPKRFELTVLADPDSGGTVSGGGTYDSSTVVPVTAAPAAGWTFTGWSGAVADSASATTTVTMDSSVTVTAHFAPKRFELTVLAEPDVGGTVSGGGTYDSSTVVPVTAAPATGWTFTGWSGAVADSASAMTTVTMDSSVTVTAHFAPKRFELTVLAEPDLGGTVSGGGTYDSSTVVPVTAAPATGWTFTGWSGAVADSASAMTTVTMDSSVTVTAHFAPKRFELTVLAEPDLGGTVSGGGTYDSSTVVPVTAAPATGWTFTGWSGAVADSASATTTVTMDSSVTVTAHFAPKRFELTVLAEPDLGGTVSGGGTYDSSTVVPVTAAPATGWTFTGWSGAVADSASATTTVTMDSSVTVTAHFAPKRFELTVLAEPDLGGTVSGGGTYDSSTVVPVTAAPATGWTFTGWSGAVADSASATTTVTMDSSVTVTAHFAPKRFELTVLAEPDLGGTVSGGGTYDSSTVVPVTAAPAAGLYVFTGWSGAVTDSASASTTVTMDSSVTVTAHFVLRQFTLVVAAMGEGTVLKDPDRETYDYRSTVELTAVAAPGWRFAGWSGDTSGSGNPLTVPMYKPRRVTALFAPGTVCVSQVYAGGGADSAAYTHDFVELHNRGAGPIDVTGWTVQCVAAGDSVWSVTPLAGTIPPGGWFLVQGTDSGGGFAPLPAPDASGSFALFPAGGTVALVCGGDTLSGVCPAGVRIVDLVGYGAAVCAEGSPAGALDDSTAALRAGGGCVDSGDNALDFTPGAPRPRNSAAPAEPCDGWVEVAPEPVTSLLLAPVAPNPTRGSARVAYALPAGSVVRLRVADLQGRVVATLVDGFLPAGRHEAAWDGSTAGGTARPGLYFVRLDACGRRAVRSLVLVR